MKISVALAFGGAVLSLHAQSANEVSGLGSFAPIPVSTTSGNVVLTNADQASLELAIAQGLPVVFAFDGTVRLTKPIVIASETTLDATAQSVILDATQAGRHFVVNRGATLRLVNFTLRNGIHAGAAGVTNANGESGMGGSIYAQAASLELHRCTFSHNQAHGGAGGPSQVIGPGLFGPATDGGPALGGAIYAAGGQVFMEACALVENSSAGGDGQTGLDSYTGAGGDSLGGAVYVTNASLTLNATTFQGNHAKAGEKSGGRPGGGGGRSYGGGLAIINGRLSATNCAFLQNVATGATRVGGGGETGNAYAGGMLLGGGIGTVVQSLFSSNRVVGAGGISRSFISNTGSDGQGGALFNSGGQLDLRDSTFAFNQAIGGTATNILVGQYGGVSGVGAGGGILNQGILTLVNCTAADNAAIGGRSDRLLGLNGGDAYGGFLFNTAGTGDLLNMTVSGNSVQVDLSPPFTAPTALAGSIYTPSGTLTAANTILACWASQTNVSGSLIDHGHNLSSDKSAAFHNATSREDVDPHLGELGENGGPTPTIPLLPGSPAIDTGDDLLAPKADQRGTSRPIGPVSDIGSFELVPAPGLVVLPGGMVQIEYTLQPSSNYRMDVSTNLVDWTVWGPIRSDTNGVTKVEDPQAALFDRRWYRLE